MKIGLVACGKSKLSHPAIARCLYNSGLFKKASAYVGRTCDRWFILSAKYGLVHPDVIIKPYNYTLKVMTAEEIVDWAAQVVAELKDLQLLKSEFEIHAGEDYVAPLRGRIAFMEPLKGLKIGQRLKWYKDKEMKLEATLFS